MGVMMNILACTLWFIGALVVWVFAAVATVIVMLVLLIIAGIFVIPMSIIAWGHRKYMRIMS